MLCGRRSSHGRRGMHGVRNGVNGLIRVIGDVRGLRQRSSHGRRGIHGARKGFNPCDPCGPWLASSDLATEGAENTEQERVLIRVIRAVRGSLPAISAMKPRNTASRKGL